MFFTESSQIYSYSLIINQIRFGSYDCQTVDLFKEIQAGEQ